MNSINERLCTLFQRWKESYEEPEREDFCKDGIDEEEDRWTSSEPKILFLLKETNKYRGDVRKDIKDRCPAPWPIVGHWAYGLQKLEAGRFPPFDEAADFRNYKTALDSSAVINLKKLAGRGSSQSEELAKAIERDRNFITEEFEILQPNIVVCGGTFELVKPIFSGFEGVAPDHRCYKRHGERWIDFCHPSSRCSPFVMYYALLTIYQNYLRSGQ